MKVWSGFILLRTWTSGVLLERCNESSLPWRAGNILTNQGTVNVTWINFRLMCVSNYNYYWTYQARWVYIFRNYAQEYVNNFCSYKYLFMTCVRLRIVLQMAVFRGEFCSEHEEAWSTTIRFRILNEVDWVFTSDKYFNVTTHVECSTRGTPYA